MAKLQYKTRAIDTELKFALENHIPVLPLMQEPSLLDMYKEKFGNLQYLDKTQSDKTALSFEDTWALICNNFPDSLKDTISAEIFM